MKFKISTKYWQKVQQFLQQSNPNSQQPPLSSTVTQPYPNSTYLILQIQSNKPTTEDISPHHTDTNINISQPNTFITNFQNLIAQKLLSQYNKQKVRNSGVGIKEWMEEYRKIFGNGKYNDNSDKIQYVNNGLNTMLLNIEYNNIKQRLHTKKQKLSQIIKQNTHQKQAYQNTSTPEQQKLKLGLQNIEYRIKLNKIKKDTNCDQENKEELIRINNLIKNGVWGLYSQIQGKLKVIQSLEREIGELRGVEGN